MNTDDRQRRRPGREAFLGAAQPPDLAADKANALALVPVSRETADRLDRFVSLLLDWQQRINLIAPSTEAKIWTRHVADSLQLLTLAPQARIWVDLGSGGGFPGLPVACALADVPGVQVHLVESSLKKAAFLREAARATDTPIIVHAVRIGDFMKNFRESADIVTARALAPLADLLSAAYPLLKRGVEGMFLKGQDVDRELTTAAKYWNIQATLVPSLTETKARIVHIKSIEKQSQLMREDGSSPQ
jgi:16S rRNA (guanine527-N7)-methyltransferase